MPSCNSDENSVNRCTYENLSGKYLFYYDMDTSEQKIEIISDMDVFETNGISGYNYWFPASPLSGFLDECDIIVDAYNNVQREGLQSPGGVARYYYESMNGHGEFYPDNDSIILFINYTRTGDFTANFSGNLYLKKVE